MITNMAKLREAKLREAKLHCFEHCFPLSSPFPALQHQSSAIVVTSPIQSQPDRLKMPSANSSSESVFTSLLPGDPIEVVEVSRRFVEDGSAVKENLSVGGYR